MSAFVTDRPEATLVLLTMQDFLTTYPTRKHLTDIIEYQRLHAVFQPIIDYKKQRYIAFEGLIRGPKESPLHMPHALFSAAERHGLRPILERSCRETILRAFAEQRLPGKLFLNTSLESVHTDSFFDADGLEPLYRIGIPPSRIVIELTENQRINDFPDIHKTLARYRAIGYQIAIDDLGEGFSNLRMWSEIQPDYVKIDRHFIDGIATDKLKHHFVKAMQSLAETCSSEIVAEGIETEADLLAVRDLGIAHGQGYLIARPTEYPTHLPSESVSSLLAQKGLLVFPHLTTSSDAITVRALTRPVEAVEQHISNDEVFRRFEADDSLTALPVINDGIAIGLINRQEMTKALARPYGRELFSKKTCALLMDTKPLCIEEGTSIQEAALIVSRSPQHPINEGFIVTKNGAYAGLGNAYKLIGMITEMQIQAARYANPLTQLPGNVPINEHIDRLLHKAIAFHACYFDIDNFKPFNDAFGYRKGDDVIQILAHTLREGINSLTDFCGHVGGDDFIVLFQSGDWESRCHAILEAFEKQILELFSASLHWQNGYYAENRQGKLEHHRLPTLSIGAVRVSANRYESHREVSAAASEAKRVAKRTTGNSLFIERRRPSGETSAEFGTNQGLSPSSVHFAQPLA